MVRVEFKSFSYIGKSGGVAKGFRWRMSNSLKALPPLYLSIGIEPSATRNASNQKSFRTEIPLILSRVLFFALFLLAVYAVQRFWFLRAWSWIATFSNSSWRFGLHAGLIVFAVALLATLLDPLFGHGISRSFGSVGFGNLSLGGLNLGKSLTTVARLWLVASFFGFLAVESVGAVEWMTDVAARLLPHAGEVAGGFSPSRRTFFQYAAVLAGGFPFLAATYGFAAGRLRYSVERVDVPVANLPPELDGLRIAQLSDIHIGDYMPPHEIARAVAMANELHPDISFVTGDFVSSVGDPLDACITELSGLRAPLGVWGCNGNHEIYAGVEDEAERLFREKGMRLLRATNAVVEHNGGRFNLLGVDYQRDHMLSGERTGPMLREIEQLIRSDMPNVLLSHNPNSFRRAAELGIELSLAGHTHGGQVKFEIVDHSVSPARLITPFVAGLYRLPMNGPVGAGSGNGLQRAALYVNRGLGTFGFPVRIGVPPEITLLTLRRA
jgi:predicted MPP superfamily phosphohydrolase